MGKIKIDFSKSCGKVKPMHAVNNGPIVARGDQTRGNLDTYKAAGIPYARNHDAAFHNGYGGEHSVDITAVFPNFDADPYDEASYDFVLTDNYIEETYMAGTETFYRLGQKIEHNKKKYGVLVPKDFKKWAVIAEHIIMHYTEGWANGFKYDMKYWEIWNEPEIDGDNVVNGRCWCGTYAQFNEFFSTVAIHLKNRFPHLKIGGPAVTTAWKPEWYKQFFEAMCEKKVPIDFFSWHLYSRYPNDVSDGADVVRETLDKYGYTDTESILNEWNYVRGWTDDFKYSIKAIIGLKGSAFTMSAMCVGQYSPVDMLMYYDARPCAFNGLFDFYTYEPLKGYYPFKMFSELYKMGTAAEAKSEDCDMYCAAAKGDDSYGIIVTHYNEIDETPASEAEILLEGIKCENNVLAEYYLLDENNDMRLVRSEKLTGNTVKLYLEMPLFSTYYIKITKQ